MRCIQYHTRESFKNILITHDVKIFFFEREEELLCWPSQVVKEFKQLSWDSVHYAYVTVYIHCCKL